MRKILSLIFILVYTSVVAQETMVIPPIRDARVKVTSSFISGTLTNTTTQKAVNEAIDTWIATGAVASVTTTTINNWNQSFSWGDHSTMGYVTTSTEADPVFAEDSAALVHWSDTTLSPSTRMKIATLYDVDTLTVISVESDPIFSASTAFGITSTNTANWQAGYDWTQAFTWPSTYTPTTHTQAWTTITDVPATYTPTAHSQPWNTITDVPATYTPTTNYAGNTSLITLGTVTTGTWSATTVDVAHGGTGTTTITGIVKGNGTSAFSAATAGTDYVSPADKLPIGGGSCDSTALTTSFKLPLGYVSYGTTIDSLVFAATTTASAATLSITVKVHYGTDWSGAGTTVVSAGSAVTTNTTATKVGTLDNSTPAKGSMLWATFPTLTTKPKSIMITVIGHR